MTTRTKERANLGKTKPPLAHYVDRTVDGVMFGYCGKRLRGVHMPHDSETCVVCEELHRLRRE